MARKGRIEFPGDRFMFQGREWSELGNRDIDGFAGMGNLRSERARASQWIGELGIYDYRHRYYQPELGRFLQTDPTGFDAGDMNLFRYCGDDPVDGSDPTGLFDLSWFKWFFTDTTKSFDAWQKDRDRLAGLDGVPFSGVVNESGLGGGNWKDTNLGNHGVNDSEMPENQPGGTKYQAWAEGQKDGSVAVYSNLNWRAAKSKLNTAVASTEVNDHVRSFRKAETAPNGRIRTALDQFKRERFRGSVAAAETELNNRLGKAVRTEYGQQENEFHGGRIYYNSHAIDQNPNLLKPITGADIERLVKSLP